jgi:hypothetical protein
MEQSGFILDKSANTIIDTLITDGKLFVDIDHHTGERIYTEMSIEARREEDLVKMAFDAFARERVGPHFTNIARSYKTIIEALYRVLEKYILDSSYSRYDMQCLMLSNESRITDILTQAKENYLPIRRAEVETKRKDEITERVW